MKNIKLVFLAIGLIVLAAGCGLERSNKTYQVTVSNASTFGDTGLAVTYSVRSVTPSSLTGYALVGSVSTAEVTVSVNNYFSSSKDFSVPQITLNHLHVAYAVDVDSANLLGTWKPTPIDTSINIVVPRASEKSSVTTIMNPILSSSHIWEVADKIVAVIATPKGGGDYNFSAALRSNILVRADVVLSGADENGLSVSSGFSTNITYIVN
jgi:hypothetical protein